VSAIVLAVVLRYLMNLEFYLNIFFEYRIVIGKRC